MNELALDRADLVVTGGVDALNDILMFMCFAQTGALSKSGDCRPFSDEADGTMLGEGVGMLALKRLRDAERDGDPVYAVLRGMGTSSDGRASSIYAPLPRGQAAALRRAYERAGYGPATIELLEAHGTATPVGDAAEFESTRTVFEEDGAPRRRCALGSVKSQIGHTKAAAGAAGADQDRDGAPSPHASTDDQGPGTEPRPAHRGEPLLPQHGSAPVDRTPRPSAPRRGQRLRLRRHQLPPHARRVPRHGPAPAAPADPALRALALRGRRCGRPGRPVPRGRGPGRSAGRHRAPRPADRSASSTRPPPARLAIVTDDDAARDKLAQATAALEATTSSHFSLPQGIHFGSGPAAGGVAFLLPGQGSQYTGMGRDLGLHFDAARAVWDRAAALDFGDGLHRRVFPPPPFGREEREEAERRLRATEWAQPGITAMSLGMLALLRLVGLAPMCVGGHSLGELTALFAAGVLDERGAVGVARRRGELMAKASEVPGAMTAVFADVDTLRALLSSWKSDVVVANHNAPGQAVLSGAVAAIEEVERRLAGEAITTRRLPVSTAFHSPLVSPSSAPFREFLEGVSFGAPTLPVYSNASAAPYPADAEAMRDQLADAIAQPVRFVEQLEAMYAAGARVFVEVGPGAVLTRLVERCLEGRPHVAVALDRPGKNGITALWEGLGLLSVSGVPLALDALWEGQALPDDPRADDGPAFRIAVSGANLGKPYPPAEGELPLAAKAAAQRGASLAKAAPATSHGAAMDTQTRATPPSSPTEAPSSPVRAPSSPAAPIGGAPLLPAGATNPAAWVEAVRQLQAPIIEAQKEYQRLMAESHMALLRAVETSYASLGQGLPGTAVSPPLVSHEPPSVEASPASMPPPPDGPRVEVPTYHAAPSSTPSAPTAAPSPPVAPGPAVDLVALMLEVVAAKTGYPAEMLALSMELEADLGIDSIKRVEILSAVKSRVPGLPEVDAARMASLRTLQEIVDFFEAQCGTQITVPDAGPTPHASNGAAQSGAAIPAATAVPADVDLVALMLEVVAAKTGYPAEMLAPSMELEADLGIDSIKRVEILSAVKSRVPGLPEVDAARMASLRTLQEIVDFLQAQGNDDASRSPDAATETRTETEAETAPHREAQATSPSLLRFAVRAVETPATGLAMPGLFGGAPVVVTPDGGVARALVSALVAKGVAATVADTVPSDARAVLFLGGLGEASSVDDAIAINRRAFTTARAAAAHLFDRPATFVTVQDTGGDFGLSGACGVRAWLAGVGALARTVAAEWPDASVKAIDIERGGRDDDAIAEALVAELLDGGPALEVGLAADGHRRTIESVAAPLRAGPGGIREGAVFLVSGGARGVTAASLLALAEEAHPRFVVLGRTPLAEEPAWASGRAEEAALKHAALDAAKRAGESVTPREIGRRVAGVLAAREVRQTLGQLEAAGAQARYRAVDVRDAEALAAVLEETRRTFGPIEGLIHGAGVLADALLRDKTDAQFAHVFDTKVLGLRALLDATRDDPLGWLCLFSSVAARVGNAGQGDYAMANEVLNKVAAVERVRRGGRCLVRSVGWGPWDSGMVTPALKQLFEARGVALIPRSVGASALVGELRGEAADVEVVLGAGVGLGASPRPVRGEVLVSAASHPQLDSHRIKGKVVLPVVLALEWLTRLAHSIAPSPAAFRLRDLHVVKGLPLAGFDGAGDRLTLEGVRATDGDAMKLLLRGADGTLHYEAALDLDVEPSLGPRAGDRAMDPSPWAHRKLYGPQTLFHGPDLQVIEALEGMSAAGARARLRGTRQLPWPNERWLTDPAALDGALQVAFLWGIHHLGGPTLPMRVAEVVSARVAGEGPLRCELEVTDRSAQHVVCDASLHGPDGEVVATLRAIEMYLVPSGTTAAEAPSPVRVAVRDGRS